MIKIMKYGDVPNDQIFARSQSQENVEDIVISILNDVKQNGDSALLQYCKKFDGADLECLEVSEEEFE